jgi:hypothetical protein
LQIYSYLLSICLNRDCLPKARLSNSSGFLEFFIFLLPLSTARVRLRAEKTGFQSWDELHVEAVPDGGDDHQGHSSLLAVEQNCWQTA